jgi:uncharacterized protein YfaS (alpha-2-macroglobulin family)
MPVTFSNTTKNLMLAEVNLELSGPIESKDGRTRTISIPAGEERRVSFNMAALSQIGQASVKFITKTKGKTYTDLTRFTVRPAAGLVKETDNGMIAPGAVQVLKPAGNFLQGSLEEEWMLSSNPAAELGHLLNNLLQYPHGCLEQTISTAFPQLYAADLIKQNKATAVAKGDPEQNIRAAIKKIESMQSYNGAFSYWQGGSEESWWGTAYAAHFLLESGKAGYEINAQILDRAFSYLKEKARSRETEMIGYMKKDGTRMYVNLAKREIAYSLYVLSLKRQPDMATMNYYKANHSMLSDDSRQVLACAYMAAGDRSSYQSLMNKAKSGLISMRTFSGSFSSDLRDRALVLNALIETDPALPSLGEMVKHLSQEMKKASWLSTSESAFGFLAIGKFSKLHPAADAA